MLGWKDVMMKQEQYKDLLREAEHRALVQQVVMDRKRRAPFDGRMLMALVRRLIDLGCSLLEYGASVAEGAGSNALPGCWHEPTIVP